MIDPPLVDSLKYKALTTTAEFRNFTPLKGDYIKWNGGNKDIVWTYDGELWRAPHQKNKHISIPLGHFAFVYGRVADVTSKLTLVGFVDPEGMNGDSPCRDSLLVKFTQRICSPRNILPSSPGVQIL